MTKTDILIRTFWKAHEELRQAEQNFDYAEPEFLEVATLELLAKRKKLDIIMQKIREEVQADGEKDLLWMWKEIIQRGS